MSAFPNSLALQWNATIGHFETAALSDCRRPINDAGALYGAILVERLRSFGCRLFDLNDRWNRFSQGLNCLSIPFEIGPQDFTNACHRVLQVNKELVEASRDVSVVIVASPGNTEPHSGPTVYLHVDPLPFAKLANWYDHGTSMFMSNYSAVPDACWPTRIKTRSRLPYYLSDIEMNRNRGSNELVRLGYALPLLRTVQGTIADTSVANIVIVDKHGVIRSPLSDDVLDGCSLKLAIRLLHESGHEVVRSEIAERDLVEAREVWLTGSTGCVWRACSLDGNQIGTDQHFPILTQLTSKWIEHVGFDFVEQSRSAH